MLDIVGAMTLTALAVLAVGVVVLTGTQSRRKRIVLATLAAFWFIEIFILAAAGVFAAPAPWGVLVLGLALLIPLAVGLAAFTRIPSWRAWALGVPLSVLIGINAGRIAGWFFLALHAAGRLPQTFAMSAGWGDVFVGLTAVPLAWAVHRRAPGWRSLVRVWNTIGMLDLIAAVTLGVGSAASPLRFIFESPDSGAVVTLPWVMIPGYLVPFYLLVHLGIFAQLAATATKERAVPMPRPAYSS